MLGNETRVGGRGIVLTVAGCTKSESAGKEAYSVEICSPEQLRVAQGFLEQKPGVVEAGWPQMTGRREESDMGMRECAYSMRKEADRGSSAWA